jgi:hypothetical protein
MSTLAEKLAKRRQEIKDRSAGGSVIFIKEGTLRIRILPAPDEVDWAVETTGFYLGSEVKGVFSADTLGEDCPILEKYKELRDSNKAGDKDIAKSMTPRTKYLVAAVVYEDEKGKEVDSKNSGKLVQIPTGVYNTMLDNYLDPEMGDFTDPETGYDFKIKRTGKGQQDTTYTLLPMRPSAIPKEYNKEVDPIDLFTETVVLTYDEAEDKLAQYLVGSSSGSTEEDEPKKKKKKRRKKED